MPEPRIASGQPVVKQRLLTAIVLIPLFLLGTIFLPSLYFGLLVGIIAALGAWEWAALIGASTAGLRLSYAGLVGVVLWVLWGLIEQRVILLILLAGALVWWCAVLFWMVMSPVEMLRKIPRERIILLIGGLAGLLVLAPAWAALTALHAALHYGPFYALFLVVMVWAADIGAYFVGTRWGARKLVPAISPGKTWEGVFGALGSVIVIALIGGLTLGDRLPALGWFVILCVVAACFSIVGDLLVSVLKRLRGIKDTGHLLPGHGGVMDRIDSLTAAAPVLVLGLMIAGGET